MSGAPPEGFDPAWLALREGRDRASRSKPLARAFLRALPRAARVADLACGGGSNARYLGSLGRRDLRWELIDADRGLLAAAGEEHRGRARRIDLARPRTSLRLARCDGVTASALCDLVSGEWLDTLVAEAARGRLPLLLALTVDGRLAFSPGDALDDAVLRRFRRDQRRDKGFGPALGPQAPLRLATALRRHGYRLHVARSDWRLAARDAPLLGAFVAGVAAAVGPEADEWLRRRRAQIVEGRLAAVVGHVDVFASLPPASAGRRHGGSICREPWPAHSS